MPEVRLIDANALKKEMENAWMYAVDMYTACSVIDAAPTIEAEPVRNGRWIPYFSSDDYNVTNVFVCSECKKSARFIMAYHECEYVFCPHCGCKMQEGGDAE